MHDLIASEFLGEHLLLRPGEQRGVKLPTANFTQLGQAVADGGTLPQWLVDAARRAWDIDLTGRSAAGTVVVRKPSAYGYGLASWEINLGCNYACEHCYLGLKEFAGLPWPRKEQLLHAIRDAGVLWFQITGGEPTIDRDFPDAYALAWDLGMMLTISTNASRLWHPKILDLLTERHPYRVVVSVYGATEQSYDGLTKRRGSFRQFERGVEAALGAGLLIRLNLVVTNHSEDELAGMVQMAEAWGVPYNEFTNMSPTI